MRGTFSTEPEGRLSLAVAINGVIVATTLSYVEGDDWVFATIIPERALRSGFNEIDVFVVNDPGDDMAAGAGLAVDGSETNMHIPTEDRKPP